MNISRPKRLFGAGILPVAWTDDDTCVFLLGDDVRQGIGFSDFGGKVASIDRGEPRLCASREFFEETIGCSLSVTEALERFMDDQCVCLRGKTQNQHAYYMFVIEVPYDKQISSRFCKVVDFLSSKNVHRLYVEKTELRWVTLDELKTIPKRSVFESTVLANAPFIGAVARGSRHQWPRLCKVYNASRRSLDDV